ncbi:MAG: ABC transporter substrate-binding protein, partial [Bifidobacterium mongoliense]|nr:ABC transporter substrate-binding protein [Bifidobacterium mongoliense]
DRFMDQAARETKLESSLVHYHASQELLLPDLPVIPLWYANVTAGAGKQMRHVSFNYMGVPEYYRLTK